MPRTKADWEAIKKLTLAERMERTLELFELVAGAIPEHGRDAARKVVPKFAGLPSISSLADNIWKDRSTVSCCLAIVENKAATPVRRLLEEYLGLTKGGMSMVLGQLEDLDP